MGDGYDVVVCTQCGAGFADGIPQQAEMDRYYAEQSKYAYEHADGVESPWDLKRFEITAEQVTPYLKSRDARILDIGCATGGLLSVLKKRGYNDVTGVDPSPSCTASAARLYGIRVRTAAFAQLANWDDRFDLIIMVGVLEHLREVKDALNIVSRLLKRGGRLYCAVPDVESLAKCPNAPYQQFSIEHVNFFSSRSLIRVMAECGMANVNIWNWTVEWREAVVEPVVSGIFESNGTPPSELFDRITGPALERYLEFSTKSDQNITKWIESLRRSQEPILVWGAGTLTRRLLATTELRRTNIVAFVDSNPHVRQRQLANKPILAPAQLKGRNETILICAGPFEKEIGEMIQNQMKLGNRTISICDPSD